jgi:hypothetical protein
MKPSGHAALKYLLSIILLITSAGCATPGQKFINLEYSSHKTIEKQGVLGLASLVDARENEGPGYVGHRILLDKSQETFFVPGFNLADTLTRVIKQYVSSRGYDTLPVSFEPTPEGVEDTPSGIEYLLKGKINAFECAANKKAGRTTINIEMDLSFVLADKSSGVIKTIPVALETEKIVMTFDLETVEEMMNQALAEVLEKALPFAD